MKKYKKIRWSFLSLRTLIMIIGIIALDQYSKYIVLTDLTTDQLSLLPFLNIVTVWNTGISFGMLADSKYSNITFLLISLVIICFVIYLALKEKNKNNLPYNLIISGGIANILDRINYGAVLDFIDFHIGKYHWPAFNIADSAIFIGIALLFFNLNEE